MAARIDILAVGSLTRDLAPAFDHYRRLLGHRAVLTVREVREVALHARSENEVLRVEGRRLLAALPPSGVPVALAIEGRSYTSPAFATRLQHWFAEGGATFVIGGTLGLPPEVLAACREQLSLSEMTLPHQLTRVVLMEQIFRALKIAAGESYHH
ncbi:MAG: 23S rRNA (pseudouridine(1915)-N(3))-methyltransferase RlmH [Thermoleophilia bacterium]